MAEVYKGQHTTLNRTVAIKVMRTDQSGATDSRARFEREAQAIVQLRHPNIIEIFDFGLVNTTYYMVMAYIPGQSLSDYLRENGRIPHHEALTYITHVANALDYAHGQNIVHRDIKPSNVMLQPETTVDENGHNKGYRAILTDFGIAKIRGEATAITRTGMVGTLDYIAPEQIQDARNVDGRADVYALGVMAYQLLTGQLPFQGSNPAAILIGHMQQIPPDPRRYVPDLPPNIPAALYKAMAKKPAERFATAGEFIAALEHGEPQ
jgi:serine/threonine protein kinase